MAKQKQTVRERRAEARKYIDSILKRLGRKPPTSPAWYINSDLFIRIFGACATDEERVQAFDALVMITPGYKASHLRGWIAGQAVAGNKNSAKVQAALSIRDSAQEEAKRRAEQEKIDKRMAKHRTSDLYAEFDPVAGF